MTNAVAQRHLPQDDSAAITLWELVDPQFLAVLGWDPEMQVLTFPQTHPLLGWPVCSVAECGKKQKDSGGLCASCARNWRLEGEPALSEFVQRPRTRRRCVGVGRCAVPGCERPWVTGGIALCSTHRYQRVTVFKLSLEEFLAHPDVVPLPAFGDCEVAACVRDRPGNGPYCHSHSVRWRDEKRRHPDLDEQNWRRTVPAVATNSEVSLRGLAPLVVAEVVYGLQERTKQGIKTTYTLVRPLCDISRRMQVSSLRDIPKSVLPKPYEGLRNGLITSASRVGLNPETERHKDIWQAVAFGHSGTLRFTEISQPWLRDAAKQWAFDDLPQRRGAGVRNVVQSRINSLAELSTSLRLQRGDHGNLVGALGREDITAFCNRLAYLAAQGAISQAKRLVHCRLVRHILGTMRGMGLTGDGKPLRGLADEFALRTSDIPDEPEDTEAGKDLPIEVMRHLCAHVTVFDTMGRPEIRVATELLIDTGRRPDEICQLGLDCLDRDTDGKPVLVYDNHKNQRLGRRLPIPEATAALIVEQQDRVRAQFPDTPAAALKLLPSPTRNPQGRKAITHGWVSQRHREWVERLPEVAVPTVVEINGERVTKLLPFDKARIFPYAYRHTYAQRHADAGVSVDVLRDLMDHRQLATTQGYYRVGEERRREAVDRVTAMQFDRHGNRVWRQAKTLLDSEHARRAIGEVAVPYGRCTEPSNVAAGGHDCPIRFRCIGCGHFDTDVSYLPDLETYLGDLLRNRERLLATIDADDWAKTEATPSDEEIRRIRQLISRIKAELDDLNDEERAQIEDAVALVRRGRSRVVGLGMPRIRHPLPDIRPDRSA